MGEKNLKWDFPPTFFSYPHSIVNHKPLVKALMSHCHSMVAAAQPFPLLKVNFPLFPVKMILKKWTSVVEDISASARDAYWVNTPGHELFQGNSNHNKTFEIVVRCSILDLSIINSNKYIVINLTKEKKNWAGNQKRAKKVVKIFTETSI